MEILYLSQSNKRSSKSCPSGSSRWVPCKFLIWKPAIFRKVKEIKYLSGGVALYAAQSNAQIDAEIAEKGGFRTETISAPPDSPCSPIRPNHLSVHKLCRTPFPSMSVPHWHWSPHSLTCSKGRLFSLWNSCWPTELLPPG